MGLSDHHMYLRIGTGAVNMKCVLRLFPKYLRILLLFYRLASDKVPNFLGSLKIARGSAMECSAVLDVIRTANLLKEPRLEAGDEILIRVVAMLTKMCR